MCLLLRQAPPSHTQGHNGAEQGPQYPDHCTDDMELWQSDTEHGLVFHPVLPTAGKNRDIFNQVKLQVLNFGDFLKMVVYFRTRLGGGVGRARGELGGRGHARGE